MRYLPISGAYIEGDRALLCGDEWFRAFTYPANIDHHRYAVAEWEAPLCQRPPQVVRGEPNAFSVKNLPMIRGKVENNEAAEKWLP